MLAILRYITYVPSLVFLIQAIVTLVESIKKHEPGEDKKKAVLEIMGTNWESLSKEFQITVPFEVLKSVISVLIDLTVSVFNVIGYFSKKDKPA